jgi:hypothetical protein
MRTCVRGDEVFVAGEAHDWLLCAWRHWRLQLLFWPAGGGGCMEYVATTALQQVCRTIGVSQIWHGQLTSLSCS